ncbi:MAG TPA: glycosyltransferase [Casimicrobiaceae bacterium]|nr:glycosyltransferase [Casimicrobiaceae bacterium]
MRQPRIAIVHDWLDRWRGGENVLAEIVHVYPQADLFSLVDFLADSSRARLGGKRARTSFLQRLPGARFYFRAMLPLFPRAIESLDVSGYDIVISSSHAVAKGVRSANSQLHICYCHTPMRYVWDLREQYLGPLGLDSGLRGKLIRRALDRLRDWDRRSSDRVTHFIANSEYIRSRIARCYDRDATVIYPPVDVRFFNPGEVVCAPAARNYYLTASRWVPYKRVDLIVAAFRELPERRLVVVGAGPEAIRVRAAAGPNVEFTGEVAPERLRELLRGARGFLFAAEEDFGILPVEAQACGTPVIAFGRGGSLETVRGPECARRTGLFFSEQSASAIAAAVRKYEAIRVDFDPVDCRTNAQRFAVDRFRTELGEFVARAWRESAAQVR